MPEHVHERVGERDAERQREREREHVHHDLRQRDQLSRMRSLYIAAIGVTPVRCCCRLGS